MMNLIKIIAPLAGEASSSVNKIFPAVSIPQNCASFVGHAFADKPFKVNIYQSSDPSRNADHVKTFQSEITSDGYYSCTFSVTRFGFQVGMVVTNDDAAAMTVLRAYLNAI